MDNNNNQDSMHYEIGRLEEKVNTIIKLVEELNQSKKEDIKELKADREIDRKRIRDLEDYKNKLLGISIFMPFVITVGLQSLKIFGGDQWVTILHIRNLKNS